MPKDSDSNSYSDSEAFQPHQRS